MKRILLIVASGKSSRFGGFPKAFCHIGDRTVVENTIIQSKDFYDRVYIGVNQTAYTQFAGKIKDAEMFSIVTGQGDAHSLLKCLDYIKERELGLRNITICWGDAVFIDSTPFEQLLAGAGKSEVAVACSIDERPYAWFETDADNGILKSHFATKEGFVERGLHDQSLFLMNFEFAISCLNEYREFLGISYYNDETYADKNEMKLLYFFEFLCEAGYGCARCVEIVSGKVLSFNTKEELKMIRKKIEIKGEK